MTFVIEVFEAIDAWPLVMQVGLISSVWLALGLACAELLFRRPARAHAVIVACSLAAIAMPIVMALARAQGWGLFVPGEVSASAPGAGPTGAIPAPQVASGAWWIWMLGSMWFCAAAIATSRLLRSHVMARRIVRQATALGDEEFQGELEREARDMGIRTTVDLLVSDEADGPVLWAWSGCGQRAGSRAAVLLPASLGVQGGARGGQSGGVHSSADRRAVLRHELAHLVRGDHWWRLAMDLIGCALALNPLVWMCRSRARAMSERACDGRAIEGGATCAADYAQLLIALAGGHRATAPGMIGMGASGARLEARLRCVLDGRIRGAPAGRGWGVFLAIGVGVLLTSGALARHRAAAPEAVSAGTAEPVDGELLLARAMAEDLGVPVRFVPEELDLGSAPVGGMGVGSAWLVNVGDKAIELESIRATCGCTTILGFEGGPLAPGQWMELTVTMTSPSSAGETKRKLVRLSARGQPDVEMAVILEGGRPGGLGASASSVDWSHDAQREADECPDCGERRVVG